MQNYDLLKRIEEAINDVISQTNAQDKWKKINIMVLPFTCICLYWDYNYLFVGLKTRFRSLINTSYYQKCNKKGENASLKA